MAIGHLERKAYHRRRAGRLRARQSVAFAADVILVGVQRSLADNFEYLGTLKTLMWSPKNEDSRYIQNYKHALFIASLSPPLSFPMHQRQAPKCLAQSKSTHTLEMTHFTVYSQRARVGRTTKRHTLRHWKRVAQCQRPPIPARRHHESLFSCTNQQQQNHRRHIYMLQSHSYFSIVWLYTAFNSNPLGRFYIYWPHTHINTRTWPCFLNIHLYTLAYFAYLSAFCINTLSK